MANLIAQTSIINHTSQLYGVFSSTFEVVALGSDKYVLTYGAGNVNSSGALGTDIRAEIWNMSGTAAVSPFLIPTIPGGQQQSLSVTETPGGGFTAAWHAQYIQTNGAYITPSGLVPQPADSIRMARFGVDGARIGNEVAFEPGGFEANIWGVAIAYSDNTETSFPLVATSAIFSQYNGIGDVGWEMVIVSQEAPNFIAQGAARPEHQWQYQMAERFGPAVTLSWYEEANGQRWIKGGIINGINQPIHSEWLVPLGAGVGASNYAQDRGYEITVLATGETVVGYDDDDGGGLVKYRIFNANGTGGGTPLYVSVDESTEAFTAGEDGIAVHALNDGGFVAAWFQQGYNNAAGQLVPSGLYMRAYDNLGNPTGTAALVKQQTNSTSYVDIDIDVGDDGAIVVGWVEYSTNSGIGGTYSRVFREAVTVTGGSGDDVLLSTAGSTNFSGLTGFDLVNYAQAPGSITASLDLPSSNSGRAAGDTYNSIEGLIGSSFDDTLNGDSNANALYGNNGNDLLEGRAGADFLDGGDGADLLLGSAGNDTLIGGFGADTVFGEQDNDVLFGFFGQDLMWGGSGNDILLGERDNDVLLGETGNDFIDGGDENDTLYGFTGDDTLLGGNGADLIVGEDDNDLAFGFFGFDTMFGGAGNDTLFGEQDNDILLGDIGSDILLGGEANDVLYGWTENDTLYGWTGDDVLWGEQGNDSLLGEDGNDTFIGGLGRDTMTGGQGADRFFSAFSEIAAGEVDLLTDYDVADRYLFQTGAQIQYFNFNAPGYGTGAGIHVQVAGGVFILDVFGANAAQLQAQTLFF